MSSELTDFQNGKLILIDKYKDWTSFDIVNKIRSSLKYRFNIKKIKVGHAGTLDPLATGLLIVGTGKKTKELQIHQDAPKEYLTTIKLGATTPSFDLETEVDETFSINELTNEKIEGVILSFKGKQKQIPSSYSAKWINGKRAYDSARKGIKVELKPADIEIYNIEIIKINLPNIELRINCSKGTYIRAIARDIGRKLNNGAHLTMLKRTKIGEYFVEDAITVDEFQKLL
ncbi:MAG: tRNA pseudouridine(55) synthase TruB [Bacteroidales bacterium]|nr:tRNA pseudouridine(55) synthase TruB [Bacteroidales bacterium]